MNSVKDDTAPWCRPNKRDRAAHERPAKVFVRYKDYPSVALSPSVATGSGGGGATSVLPTKTTRRPRVSRSPLPLTRMSPRRKAAATKLAVGTWKRAEASSAEE